MDLVFAKFCAVKLSSVMLDYLKNVANFLRVTMNIDIQARDGLKPSALVSNF